MWFKTRHGLADVQPPFEILAWQSPKTKQWAVYIRMKYGPEGEGRDLFRKVNLSNPYVYLAWVEDGAAVASQLGQIMASIETAIRSQALVCDLSTAGSATAWGKGYHLIQWPPQ